MCCRVLYKSLARLARAVTPSHPSLRIPLAFRGEAPWPSAQAEIGIINAYKSAKDKLDCVVRWESIHLHIKARATVEKTRLFGIKIETFFGFSQVPNSDIRKIFCIVCMDSSSIYLKRN